MSDVHLFYRTWYPRTRRLRAAIETDAVSAASSPTAARCGGFRLGRTAASSWYYPRGRCRRGTGYYGDYREGRHADRWDDCGKEAYKKGRYFAQWKICISTQPKVLSNLLVARVRFLVTWQWIIKCITWLVILLCERNVSLLSVHRVKFIIFKINTKIKFLK